MEKDNRSIILHGSHEKTTHRVNLDNYLYTNVICEVTGYTYTQIVFNRETWLNVRETEEQIFGISDSDRVRKKSGKGG